MCVWPHVRLLFALFVLFFNIGITQDRTHRIARPRKRNRKTNQFESDTRACGSYPSQCVGLGIAYSGQEESKGWREGEGERRWREGEGESGADGALDKTMDQTEEERGGGREEREMGREGGLAAASDGWVQHGGEGEEPSARLSPTTGIVSENDTVTHHLLLLLPQFLPFPFLLPPQQQQTRCRETAGARKGGCV